MSGTTTYGSDDLPLFNADFSTEKTVVLRIEAPAGQRFVIDAPGTFRDMRYLVTVGTRTDSPLNAGPMTDFVIEYLIGTALFITGEFQDEDYGGGDFAIQITGVFDGPVSFSALEATFQVPNDFDVIQIDNPEVFAALTGNIEGTSSGAPLPDPGLWLQIVPEPTSLALLAMGGLLMHFRSLSFLIRKEVTRCSDYPLHRSQFWSAALSVSCRR
ncbi:MAG: PEP-CTERM sorting domain-containing protein [Planctomycetota bacterium]